MKTILDPIHGHIKLSKLQDELLHLPEVQRLAWVRQLGLTKLVYPGANHSRLEHALGVSFLSNMIAGKLEIEERELLQAAGLLHDVSHTPFSHALEPLLPEDHMQLAVKIITGKQVLPVHSSGMIPEVLEAHGLDPKEVADLIVRKHSNKLLQSVIFSEIDADQLDFLQRDSHYSGAKYGVIDAGRIIEVMRIMNNEIVFMEKGLEAVEAFLIAREHMYSTVYAHHTASIAEKMLLRAMELVVDEVPEFYALTDGELLSRLLQRKGYVSEIAERIITRKLFKRVIEVTSNSEKKLKEKAIDLVSNYSEKELEEELTRKSGIPKGFLLVDMPSSILELTEPRMREFNIKLVSKTGEVNKITRISHLARALQRKKHTLPIFSVYCDKRYLDSAQKAVAEVLK